MWPVPVEGVAGPCARPQTDVSHRRRRRLDEAGLPAHADRSLGDVLRRCYEVADLARRLGARVTSERLTA